MKDSRFDIALMVKVAQMYYLDGLKQEDIAKALSISRSLTSMILTEAKEVGIVEIQVKTRWPTTRSCPINSRISLISKIAPSSRLPCMTPQCFENLLLKELVTLLGRLLKAARELAWVGEEHAFNLSIHTKPTKSNLILKLSQ